MSRIDHGINNLVAHFLVKRPKEDGLNAEEQSRREISKVRQILEDFKEEEVTEPEDIDFVADRLRGKILQTSGHDNATRFSNLYSRFLPTLVVHKKGAILEFLDALSNESRLDANGEGRDPRDGYEADLAKPSQSWDRSAANATSDEQGMLSGRHLERLQLDGPDESEPTSTRFVNGAHNLSQTNTLRAGPYSTSIGSMVPSEAAILRDLPFTLQGLSSTTFPFADNGTLKLPASLPLPVLSLLHTLAEPSLLYRSLSIFIEAKADGLIAQSLRSAIANELRAYLGLIATIEGEIRRSNALLQDNLTSPGGLKNTMKATVTLKRCVVWTREATVGLRLMSVMAEESKSKRGGQLITFIHSFVTSNGDPFISAFAERVLSHLTKPFYNMLRRWIYDGELIDPYHEFFVVETNSSSSMGSGINPRLITASSVWEDKYKQDDEMIPSIITDEFAHKVFLIGKSLNFARHSCGDSAWVEAYAKDSSRELTYGDTASLETSIDIAYKATMARLIHLMDQKFHLFEHLDALKKYLLLGQGDFIALLMESLASNLDRPAGTQYRHTLTAQLEHAIRGSNAQFDARHVLNRLDARLLEHQGEQGWEVFTLEYKVDAPADVVLTAWSNQQYLKAFNFLWRIKRVEFSLSRTWRRCMTGARGVLGSVAVIEKLGDDWKTARCCLAEMIHLINQLQYYLLFEVIETSWNELHAKIRRPNCTLDDLVHAHRKYLEEITGKGLLGGEDASTTHKRHHKDLKPLLHEITKGMMAYRDVVEGLYGFSVAEFSRAQGDALRRDNGTRRSGSSRPSTAMDDTNNDGRSTDSPVPQPLADLMGSSDEQMLASLRKRLSDVSAHVKDRICTLLGELEIQPDHDLKFLGTAMNFNEVYKPKKRHRPQGQAPSVVSRSAVSGKDREKERDRDHDREREKEVARGQAQENGVKDKG
ncbi:Microtubule-nucleating Tub4p (gamma-tubulin) complex component [Agyrium rufum]|nr:Microtubule-nucleating Tub4p (gamma-tubulin) complex component [Agyrium rufum]